MLTDHATISENNLCLSFFFYKDTLLHFAFKSSVSNVGESSKSELDFENIQPKNPQPLPSGIPPKPLFQNI